MRISSMCSVFVFRQVEVSCTEGWKIKWKKKKKSTTTYFITLYQFLFLLWHAPGLIIYSTYFLWINKHWILCKEISQPRSSFLEKIDKKFGRRTHFFVQQYFVYICKNINIFPQKINRIYYEEKESRLCLDCYMLSRVFHICLRIVFLGGRKEQRN